MGTTKGGIEMAKKAAKSASKEATKKVGQQVGKEIAKGVATEAVEEVWHEGTKMTFNKFLQNKVLGHQHTCIRGVLWHTTFFHPPTSQSLGGWLKLGVPQNAPLYMCV